MARWSEAAKSQPRSGARIQPTAQAVGDKVGEDQAPESVRENFGSLGQGDDLFLINRLLSSVRLYVLVLKMRVRL